ncbi:hypothetical protein BHU72_01960 [Desulfuribacillus stibiiarsenatis]|uniref:DUF3800 domain-containing protein n=1 Tax=Desulfuribacillus stibiiarsenatis TaxID=1390249 RepID=A0A1E5L6B7_9FIRM|nr:DUF3800 domain-containing protein [Desulfuribacillus stibiiarsenatis]OEH85588.1 hypothetical protein BHU72_01960 [Desulfuribacillus stibiiarsenatis]
MKTKSRKLFLYIDESIFSYNGQNYFAVGMMAVVDEASESVIEKALTNLKNDPDIHEENTKEWDNRTLERGYFHATDDSKNAHSHLCNSIKEHLNAKVSYVVLKPHDSNFNLTVEQKHRINTELVSLIATEFIGEIKIVIENRISFSETIAQQFYENLYEVIDASVYTHPWLSANYPKIDIEVVGKENPGVQVIDFITWALNNFYSNNKKGIWFERLSLQQRMKYDQPDGDLAGGEYSLGNSIKENLNIYLLNPYPDEAFPLNDDFYNNIFFEMIYLLAEQILNKIFRDGLPEHVIHFESELNELVTQLKGGATNLEMIKKVAKLFIRLFDTMPIYSELRKDIDYKAFKFILHVRRCMGLVVMERYMVYLLLRCSKRLGNNW